MQELWETWVLSLGRKMLWSRARQFTPVFLPGKSHGCRRLVGYRSWGFNRVRHNLVTKNSPLYTIYVLHLLYPFLYSWKQHLGCFHFLAIVNSSPMNTGMLISFQSMFFFFFFWVYTQEWDYWVLHIVALFFRTLKNLHTLLHSGCINLQSYQ